MARKVEGKPCKRCGSTERYEKGGRRFGQCVFCKKSKEDGLSRYYKSRELRRTDIRYRINALVINARCRSSKQGLQFDIDTDFMLDLWKDQDGKCALSGRTFTLDYNENGGPHQNGPSIDKIVPELGYIRGNVRFVTYHVNTALSNFGDSALIALLEDIKNFKENK